MWLTVLFGIEPTRLRINVDIKQLDLSRYVCTYSIVKRTE